MLRTILQRSRATSEKPEWSRVSADERRIVEIVVAQQTRLILRRIVGRLRAALERREALPDDVTILVAKCVLLSENAEDQIRLSPPPVDPDADLALYALAPFADCLEALEELFDRLKPQGLETLG